MIIMNYNATITSNCKNKCCQSFISNYIYDYRYYVIFLFEHLLLFFSFSPRLPKLGETIVGTKFEKKYGGKGANQCITAAKLGGSTALIASVLSFIYAFIFQIKLSKIYYFSV